MGVPGPMSPRLDARRIQVALARHPAGYLRLLRLLGRGSVVKRVSLAVLRRGDVIVDVGANEGYLTLLFSDVAGPIGRVHAFEPVPPTFARLSARVGRDAWFRNIATTDAACSDGAGQTTIYVPGTDAAQSSLAMHAVGSWKASATVSPFTVRCLRLDDYFGGPFPARADFMKIDVEGAELWVLEGAARLVRTCRPLLCAEMYAEWTRAFGYQPIDLLAHLERCGYDRFYVLGSGVHAVDPATAAQVACRQPIDLLCAVGTEHAARLEGLRPLLSPSHPGY